MNPLTSDSNVARFNEAVNPAVSAETRGRTTQIARETPLFASKVYPVMGLALLLLGAPPGACKGDKPSEPPAADESRLANKGRPVDELRSTIEPQSAVDLESQATCEAACSHTIELALTDIDNTSKNLPPEVGQNLKKMAEESRESDMKTCVSKCEQGWLDTTCAVKASSIDEVAQCIHKHKVP